MRRTIRLWIGSAGLLLAASQCGCDRLVRENLAIGLRDGALATLNGIVEGAFNAVFELEDDSETDEESGDDLFVNT